MSAPACPVLWWTAVTTRHEWGWERCVAELCGVRARKCTLHACLHACVHAVQTQCCFFSAPPSTLRRCRSMCEYMKGEPAARVERTEA